jgi:hypothetical protein
MQRSCLPLFIFARLENLPHSPHQSSSSPHLTTPYSTSKAHPFKLSRAKPHELVGPSLVVEVSSWPELQAFITSQPSCCNVVRKCLGMEEKSGMLFTIDVAVWVIRVDEAAASAETQGGAVV